MSDRIDQALADLGIDPADIDPAVLDTLRAAADQAPPAADQVRTLLEAAARGERVDEGAVQDAARAGAPYRQLRNRITEIQWMQRNGQPGDAQQAARTATNELVGWIERGGPPATPTDDRTPNQIIASLPPLT